MLGLLVALFAMAASAQNVGVSIALPMANSFPPAYCPRVCLNVTAQQWSRTVGGGQGPEFEKFAKVGVFFGFLVVFLFFFFSSSPLSCGSDDTILLLGHLFFASC